MNLATPSFRLRPSVLVIWAITIGCVIGFGYLWKASGGHLPGYSAYTVSFDTADLKNLQPDGDVRIAGVKVGSVLSESTNGKMAHVVLAMDSNVIPLHTGVTVRVGVKSVIGESFVDIKDGTGPSLSSGSALPSTSVVPAVDVDELVRMFTPQTRKALAGMLTQLGTTSAGSEQSIADAMRGLGEIGSSGYTAVDAIANQNDDIASLVQQTTQILQALNTHQEALASVVTNVQKLGEATASQRVALAQAMTLLPNLMVSARTATSSLGGLAQDLTPVAHDLAAAAPDLSAALQHLPSVTKNLRALLPPMNASFGAAGATLSQVPTLSQNVVAIAPGLDVLLRNVNPMLGYIQPYSFDIGSFFGDFGGAFDIPLENGVSPARLAPIFNEYSVRNLPLNLQTLNPLHWNNPYPAPGQAGHPSKYVGTYTRLLEEK